MNSNRYYLPPIKSNFTFTQGSSGLSTRGSREYNEILLPKTFTTRKGALLLFSEDFALRDKERETTQKDGPAVSINTVEDLARSILSYGSQVTDLNFKNKTFQVELMVISKGVFTLYNCSVDMSLCRYVVYLFNQGAHIDSDQ